MQREVSASFGVVLERRPSTSKWADWSWSVVDVIADAPATDGWTILSDEDGRRRYLSSPHVLQLHHKMVDAYDANIETGAPSVWVMLDEMLGAAEPAYRVRGITTDPYEAQGVLDSAEGIVDRLPMPKATVAWMAKFLASLPDAPAFRKRRRDRVEVEKQIFGKEPIFSPLGRKEEREE
ncbi:DUF3305 domain-containing protein [Stappia sp.]|uniref:DUF3305 domain-containing protein n=1 Tax=Stappia sp. TaxID=1870903 RepID=UPI003A9A3666